MSAITGVFPCYENQFKVATTASDSAPSTTIANCESFSVAFDNGVEEWNAFEEKGWSHVL